MNLSSDTVNVLKNFSDINQNILVKPGNKIQTISTMKNILAEAEVSEKFEDEFAIYDLPEFLRSVELFEKPDLNLTVVLMLKYLNLHNQLNISLLINQLSYRQVKVSICQISMLHLL